MIHVTQHDRRLAQRAQRRLARMDEQRMRLGFGDGATLFVTGRNGFVYARPLIPSTATASQVRCRSITPAYGLVVIVKPGDDGILEVAGVDPRFEDDFAGSTGANFSIAPHAPNHGRYGPDPVFLKGQQYLPLSVIPSTPAGQSIYVNPGWYVDSDGVIQWFAGATVDLSTEIGALTTNQQQLVIIALDRSDGTITATTGAAIVASTSPSYDMPFTAGNVQDIDTGTTEQRLQAVRIYAGQTTVQLYDAPDTFDLRLWFDHYSDTLPLTKVLDADFIIQDDADPTKQFQFQASGITAGQTRIGTLPNYNFTFASLAGTETFTNKTLTSPVINTPAISGGTADNMVIGATTPAAGTFTTIAGTSAVINNGASGGFMTVRGNAGTNRGFRWETSTSLRWLFQANSTAEGGSNAGSDIALSAFADDGVTSLGSPLTITRANGNMILTSFTNFTNAPTQNVIYRHSTSGTPTAGFGIEIRYQAHSSTNTLRLQSAFITSWVVATDASRTARGILYAYDTAARECIRIEASGAAPMVGLYGVAAVARAAAYTQTYSTTTRTVNPASTAAFTGIDNAQAGTVYAKLTDLNQLRTDMLQMTQLINSLIDDSQGIGIAQ